MDPINWIQNPFINRDCLDSWDHPLSLFSLSSPPYDMYTFIFPPRDPTCHGSSREHILLGTWGSLCHEISIATGVGRSGVMAVKAMEHWETPGKDGTECNVDIGSVLNNNWTSKICKTLVSLAFGVMKDACLKITRWMIFPAIKLHF